MVFEITPPTTRWNCNLLHLAKGLHDFITGDEAPAFQTRQGFSETLFGYQPVESNMAISHSQILSDQISSMFVFVFLLVVGVANYMCNYSLCQSFGMSVSWIRSNPRVKATVVSSSSMPLDPDRPQRLSMHWTTSLSQCCLLERLPLLMLGVSFSLSGRNSFPGWEAMALEFLWLYIPLYPIMSDHISRISPFYPNKTVEMAQVCWWISWV